MRGQPDNALRAKLEEMDLLPTNQGEKELYFVSDRGEMFDKPSIRIALEKAAEFEADAVFFRVFPDDNRYPKRLPIPQIFIYHDTSLSLNESWYAEIHRNLWNAGVVPLAFIFSVDSIKILNCRKVPEIKGSKPAFSPFDKLEKLIAADRKFIVRAIAAGTLWDNPSFKDDFRLEETAYFKLLDFLKAYRKKLIKQKIADELIVNRLLVIAMLIKYLSDRKDSNGNRVFKKGFFRQFLKHEINIEDGADNLDKVFRDPSSCIKLFDCLSQHFNGGIFEFSTSEKQAMLKADLSPIADFLAGDREPNGQGIFWPLYSFEYLPVELISNIYEEFLAKKTAISEKGEKAKEDTKGIVYTPPMLVDLLLDQCLSFDADILDWRIVDPACGSGVFLVGVFKRLVHCWRMANHWRNPTHSDLQGILKKNVFGFDKEPEAILITAFSLYIALFDELEPLVIWNELKFDDLRENNLQAKDFFEIMKSGKFDGYFDLVIGNPPFDSKLETHAAKQLEKRLKKQRPPLPDNQAALLFLEQSFRLGRDGATICLIQPAGPLLYNGSAQAFRQALFNDFHIAIVFDFTALEDSLFKAQVAAAAVIGFNKLVKTDKVLHVTFRRTKAIKEKLLFELDAYDFHWVSIKSINSNKQVWKANLLGGGRLHRLLERLIPENASTLGEYLNQREEHDGWQFCEGYSVGCGHVLNDLPNRDQFVGVPANQIKEKFKLKRTPELAPWITGKSNVSPDILTKNGFVRKPKICDYLFFEEPRKNNKKIFEPPHVLIRKKIDDGVIPVEFSNEYLVFSKQIIGIHAKDEQKLRMLTQSLSGSKLFAFLAVVISGRILVSRETSLLQQDILAVPYQEESEDIKLRDWEQSLIDDVMKVLVDFRRKGEKSVAVKAVSFSELLEFGEMYCRILNSIYENFQPLPPIILDHFVCYPFCYGEAPEIEIPAQNKAVDYLEELLSRQVGRRLFVNRIIRTYEQNVILMVKPNQKRFWLRSMAMRDADETLVDMLHQGY
ncbi:HsdM family class I SAM-dependent methyltransferase [Methylomagnum sp.]